MNCLFRLLEVLIYVVIMCGMKLLGGIDAVIILGAAHAALSYHETKNKSDNQQKKLLKRGK